MKVERDVELSAGLVRRNISLQTRASSLDAEAMTVEAVISTENVATVFDYRLWEEIDEVLQASGREEAPHVVLLDAHERQSVNSVYGSVDQFRTEGTDSIARLTFTPDDAQVLGAFRKIQHGHLRAVSIGYEVLASQMIEAGQTVSVNGQEYTAGPRSLRIGTKWIVREVSLVPIGADEFALIRAAIRADRKPDPALPATETTETTETPAATVAPANGATPGTRNDTRTGAAHMPKQETTGAATVEPIDAQAEREAATKAERKRVRDIRAAADGLTIKPETLQRAEDEGWTVERANAAFLTEMRERRPDPVTAEAPGQISRSRDKACTVDSLAAALAIRSGVDPMLLARNNLNSAGLKFRAAGRITDERKTAAMNNADRGDEFVTLSLLDICREALRIDGVEIPHDRDEMMKRAVSTPALTTIFTSTMGAKLLAAYETTEDSSVAWTSEEDVTNFLTNERHTFGSDATLQQLPSGGQADHASAEDGMESYKIRRFARRASVDDQTIINDNLGAVMAWMDEFGEAARHVRPDLVYSLLAANAALDTDGVALFNAAHNNLTGTAALAAATLQAAITRLATQTQYGRNLNLPPAYVICPRALEFTAAQILNSAERRDTGGAATDGTANPLFGRNLDVVPESRLDNGVTDPVTGTTYAGSASTWYLATKSGRHTVVVGYLSGTGRAPLLRSANFVGGSGSYGLAWDIKLDIGGKALDFRGLQKMTA